jgi:hypothetical protein
MIASDEECASAKTFAMHTERGSRKVVLGPLNGIADRDDRRL